MSNTDTSSSSSSGTGSLINRFASPNDSDDSHNPQNQQQAQIVDSDSSGSSDYGAAISELQEEIAGHQQRADSNRRCETALTTNIASRRRTQLRLAPQTGLHLPPSQVDAAVQTDPSKTHIELHETKAAMRTTLVRTLEQTDRYNKKIEDLKNSIEPTREALRQAKGDIVDLTAKQAQAIIDARNLEKQITDLQDAECLQTSQAGELRRVRTMYNNTKVSLGKLHEKLSQSKTTERSLRDELDRCNLRISEIQPKADQWDTHPDCLDRISDLEENIRRLKFMNQLERQETARLKASNIELQAQVSQYELAKKTSTRKEEAAEKVKADFEAHKSQAALNAKQWNTLKQELDIKASKYDTEHPKWVAEKSVLEEAASKAEADLEEHKTQAALNFEQWNILKQELDIKASKYDIEHPKWASEKDNLEGAVKKLECCKSESANKLKATGQTFLRHLKRSDRNLQLYRSMVVSLAPQATRIEELVRTTTSQTAEIEQLKVEMEHERLKTSAAVRLLKTHLKKNLEGEVQQNNQRIHELEQQFESQKAETSKHSDIATQLRIKIDGQEDVISQQLDTVTQLRSELDDLGTVNADALLQLRNKVSDHDTQIQAHLDTTSELRNQLNQANTASDKATQELQTVTENLENSNSELGKAMEQIEALTVERGKLNFLRKLNLHMWYKFLGFGPQDLNAAEFDEDFQAGILAATGKRLNDFNTALRGLCAEREFDHDILEQYATFAQQLISSLQQANAEVRALKAQGILFEDNIERLVQSLRVARDKYTTDTKKLTDELDSFANSFSELDQACSTYQTMINSLSEYIRSHISGA